MLRMIITKIGHCCLLIEIAEKKILTDPGSFTTAQNEITDVDIILVTHEHADHVHVESLVKVYKKNPQASIVTNTAVAKLLENSGIAVTICEGRDSCDIAGIHIDAFDGKHEEIFGDIGQVQNTGYLIARALFYPGDSFHAPNVPVDVLALPVGGPWCKIADAVRYALVVKPRIAFPVHDATVKDAALAFLHRIPTLALSENGIEFIVMNAGDTKEF